ncbi:MAG: glycosyltransferase, partial [Clostridia bacterium]|nr:glycosyltransferase [Clostridia bacterium]
IYPLIAVLFRKKYLTYGIVEKRRYAVLICARNEENVVGKLIESIQMQDYPSELVDIYVLADNCNDNTAAEAKKSGAEVFVRNDQTKVGKGYALNYLYAKIILKKGDIYDGFFVFDADNLLAKDYISKMNRSFKGGMHVVTGIRNTKNFADNWISACYGIGWFFQSGLLNKGRSVLGIPCFVTGTGFLIGSAVLKQKGGWNCFTLTEDCEFTVDCALSGIEIGICSDAEIYDEQPTSLRVSWAQRLRWMRGKYQILGKYWKPLLKGIFSKKFLICFDSFSNIFPTGFFVFISAVFTVFQIAVSSGTFETFVPSLISIIAKTYLSMSLLGILTLIVWWKNIKVKSFKKILLTLFYPIHVASYVPITFVAAFRKIEWTPIKHNVVKSIREFSGNESETEKQKIEHKEVRA